MKEFESDKVPYYVLLNGVLVLQPIFANGDWVRVQDFEELLEAYYELKHRMDGLDK